MDILKQKYVTKIIVCGADDILFQEKIQYKDAVFVIKVLPIYI